MALLTSVCTHLSHTPLSAPQCVMRVIAVALKSGQGALAEYTKLPADMLIAKPDSVKTIDAAGLMLAGMTAYQALFKGLKLEPGQSLFINGGSTAIGIYAIQMAKSIGCTVTATASAPKEEFLRSLGLDNVRTNTHLENDYTCAHFGRLYSIFSSLIIPRVQCTSSWQATRLNPGSTRFSRR